MNNDSSHPARFPDFLSRLHDGELTAGERAHFESHRAHCSECRRAASEFEAALSFFRASTTSAPSSDLARRILRKLEVAAPPRRRFGIVHGISPKWAAGFAVAVIAAVLGSAIVLEREAARNAILRQVPIPVVLEKEKSQAGKARKPSAPEEPVRSGSAAKDSGQSPREESFAPESPPLLQSRSGSSAPAAPSAEPKRGQQPPTPAREAREAASEAAVSVSPRARDAAPPRASKILERSGGEGAAAPSTASAEPGAPARLVIQALDGEGNAPAVLSPDASEMLAGLRGRQYSLLVEAGGRVREARLDGKRPRGARPRARESVASDSAPPSVWSLRFTPGDRPRRLLLRVE
jgi:hypothetical protein